jgi:hypothetical protein
MVCASRFVTSRGCTILASRSHASGSVASVIQLRVPDRIRSGGLEDAGAPAGRASSSGRSKPRGVDANPREEPRDDRIGVPHLVHAGEPSAPHVDRRARDGGEDRSRHMRVSAHELGAGGRVACVKDPATRPAAYLVAERSPAREGREEHRALHDDAARGPVPVRDRPGVLDDGVDPVDVHDERAVVERRGRASLARGSDALVDLAVEADEATAGSQRDPVEVNPRGQRARSSWWP